MFLCFYFCRSNCPFWWQDIYPRRCGLAVFSGVHPNCQQGHQNPGLSSCGNPAVLPSGTNDDIPGKHFGLQEPYLGILSLVVRPQIKSPTSLNSNWWRSGSSYSTKSGQTDGQSTSVSTNILTNLAGLLKTNLCQLEPCQERGGKHSAAWKQTLGSGRIVGVCLQRRGTGGLATCMPLDRFNMTNQTSQQWVPSGTIWGWLPLKNGPFSCGGSHQQAHDKSDTGVTNSNSETQNETVIYLMELLAWATKVSIWDSM